MLKDPIVNSIRRLDWNCQSVFSAARGDSNHVEVAFVGISTNYDPPTMLQEVAGNTWGPDQRRSPDDWLGMGSYLARFDFFGSKDTALGSKASGSYPGRNHSISP
jgi:hypothetical protein